MGSVVNFRRSGGTERPLGRSRTPTITPAKELTLRRPTARAYAASAAALAALLTPGQAAAQATGTDRAATAATVIEKVPYAMDSSNQAAWWT